ncbi:TOMM precursor leader peptide-binding protein [Streptomyces sp. NPDC051907]|uniref:TOMM precursor leader peptide-binding protein n=1 Tax=Streptomyces sp. NPDC051907 TaxID=3155284 RepID=UPI003435C406
MTPTDQLALADHLHLESDGDTAAVLLAETSGTLFNGRLYARLLPLMDGTRSLSDLATEVSDEFSAVAVAYAIERLEARGVLRSTASVLPRNQEAYWSAHSVGVAAGATGAWASVNCLEGHASARQEFVDALAILGVSTDDSAALGKPALTVVLTSDYLDPCLAEVNAEALETERPWMLLRTGGATSWIGPLLVPGGTGCWECLAHRLRYNLRSHEYVRSQGSSTVMSRQTAVGLPTTAAATLGIAAGQVAAWLRSRSSPLTGHLATLDLLGMSVVRHPVVRRPQCHSCGDLDQGAPGRVVLESRRKSYITDGGHRSSSPEKVLRQFGHHVSPLTGVVSELTRYETGSDLVTVYAGVVKGGRPARSLAELRHHSTSGSAGKGVTDAQARASALCEALERISGEYTGDEPKIVASYTDLGRQAVHPKDLLQVSEIQYQTREAWNRSHSSFAWVPDPFDQHRPISWTPAQNITDGSIRYLPTAFCFYGAPVEPGHLFCRADSNGCASGSSMEDAVLQGFLELVERDSVAIWWYNRLRRPAVDLSTVKDPYVSSLRQEYRRRNRELWALDITTDLGIPSFAAISRCTDSSTEMIIQGYGTHLHPEVALLRALTEMNQMLALVESAGDHSIDDPDNASWFEEATVASEPYLLPHPDMEATSLHEMQNHASPDLAADVQHCVRIAADRGMETLVVNQTRPDLGIDVVKVVVPGLRHFWARFASGRLYEVPVRMGWRTNQLLESQLNPRPISS